MLGASIARSRAQYAEAYARCGWDRSGEWGWAGAGGAAPGEGCELGWGAGRPPFPFAGGANGSFASAGGGLLAGACGPEMLFLARRPGGQTRAIQRQIADTARRHGLDRNFDTDSGTWVIG